MRRRIQISLSLFIILLLAFERCAYNDINVDFNCDQSTLALTLVSKTDASNCRAIDGSISVLATGGLEPYDYSIAGGEYQTNNVLANLQAGTYEIRVKDMNSCWKTIEVTIGAAGSTLAATFQTTADSECGGDNGIATIAATGGSGKYEYQIDAKGFGATNKFEALKEGTHSVVVKDSEGCQTTLSVHIAHGNTGISYKDDIKEIISTNCAKSGCHDAGSGSRNWTDFNKLKSNAANVKLRTANRTMPPDFPLSQEDIDKIGCWVDDGAIDN
jgi:hypothetical protein